MTMAYFRHKSFHSSFLSIIFTPAWKTEEITNAISPADCACLLNLVLPNHCQLQHCCIIHHGYFWWLPRSCPSHLSATLGTIFIIFKGIWPPQALVNPGLVLDDTHPIFTPRRDQICIERPPKSLKMKQKPGSKFPHQQPAPPLPVSHLPPWHPVLGRRSSLYSTLQATARP